MENNNNSASGKKVLSGIAWSYAERMTAQVVALVVSVVLARILDPEHYGILAIVTVFTSIADALVTGGLGNALIQKRDADNVDFNSICWVSILLALGLYGILYVGAPAISVFYEMEELTLVTRVLGLRVLFSAFNSIQQAYVQKRMMFRKYFWASLSGAVVSAVIGIGMALSGAGVWALVAQNLSLTIISTFVLFVMIDWKPGLRCSMASVKSMWGYGIKMLLSTMTYTVKDNIRSLVVGKYFTSETLAYYNQGKKYPALLVSDVVESIGKVLFPVLSNRQDDLQENKKLMRVSVRMSSFILLPLILGLLAVSDTFVSFLLTDKWMDAAPYMRILCLVYITRPMSTVFQKALLAIGRSNVNLVHEIFTSVLTLLLIVVAVLMESVEFIAWSYVIIAIAGTGFFAVFVSRDYGYSIAQILGDYLPALVLSGIMCGAVWMMGGLQMHVALKLVAQVAVGAVIYLLGAWLFKMQAMKDVLQFAKKAMRKRPGNKGVSQ